MKILLCHNFYQQPGGEDQVFADEGRLLESQGHDVLRYTLHNDDIAHMSRWSVAVKTLWNSRGHAELSKLLREERVDVMHCTNTFPLISPAAYYAARSAGVPVVQSLHNYRLLCPNALFLRDGRVCEDCLGRLPLPAVVHGCYRGSRAGSAVLTAMLGFHRALRTWKRMVAAYIALSEFSRDKFIAGGLPADRIHVKPNFVAPDPGTGDGEGGYAIFVGRLSPEKGVETLLAAWRHVTAAIPLWIVGDGPLAGMVEQAAAGDSRIRWLGRRPPEEICPLVGEAACLVMPSACYEHCPRALLEAFAVGTPVVVSGMGAMAEFVEDGVTGLHAAPGDPVDLAGQVAALLTDPDRLARLRRNARCAYETLYTARTNYDRLLSIYQQALDRAPGSRQRTNVPTPAVAEATGSTMIETTVAR
jgi:glycosyltransferase involved in cell wall biosynthesis